MSLLLCSVGESKSLIQEVKKKEETGENLLILLIGEAENNLVHFWDFPLSLWLLSSLTRRQLRVLPVQWTWICARTPVGAHHCKLVGPSEMLCSPGCSAHEALNTATVTTEGCSGVPPPLLLSTTTKYHSYYFVVHYELQIQKKRTHRGHDRSSSG